MSSAYYLQDKLTINIALLPAVVVTSGLGAICVLTPAGATPISGGFTSVTSLADVATLLADTKITASGAAQLNACFGQHYDAGTVYVATYDDSTGDPADAADIVEAQSVDIGYLVPSAVVDADLAALGAWLSADSARTWRYAVIAESRNAALLTASFPSALEDCQVDSFTLIYGASTVGTAGKYAANLCGRGLVRPQGSEIQLKSADLPGETAAELEYVLLNDCMALRAMDNGNAVGERMIRGIKNASGNDAKVVWSLMYMRKLLAAAFKAYFLSKGITGDPMSKGAVGQAEATAVAGGPLASMAANGHFEPGSAGTAPNVVTLSQGWQCTAAVVGENVVLTVLVLVAGQVNRYTINVTAQEV